MAMTQREKNKRKLERKLQRQAIAQEIAMNAPQTMRIKGKKSGRSINAMQDQILGEFNRVIKTDEYEKRNEAYHTKRNKPRVKQTPEVQTVQEEPKRFAWHANSKEVTTFQPNRF